jgi:GNAT superfamily N-acetyltransferase
VVIQLAETDAEIERCFPVMAQLRPHLEPDAFVGVVRQQMAGGYRLAYLVDNGEVRAVAGYRVLDMLAHGRVLYVDDLVTDAATRSRGHGDGLFDWLCEEAWKDGCQHLHLDSGVQRAGAHRFYFRKRMQIASYHFALPVER